MDPHQWKGLVKRRDKWVAHNFPQQGDRKHDTILGVIEETGELTHHRLKMVQGIRGTNEEHLAEMQDAIGDISVYLMGVFSYTGLIPPHPQAAIAQGNIVGQDEDQTLFKLSFYVGRLAEQQFTVGLHVLSMILATLEKFCHYYGWDYDDIVQSTWEKVEERDWIAFPTDGRTA